MFETRARTSGTAATAAKIAASVTRMRKSRPLLTKRYTGLPNSSVRIAAMRSASRLSSFALATSESMPQKTATDETTAKNVKT